MFYNSYDNFTLGLDDNDCSGNCEKCVYAVWAYDNEAYPIDCRL